MASQDALGKTTDQSTASANIAGEAKLSGEGAKPRTDHAFLSICKSLVAGGVAGGV